MRVFTICGGLSALAVGIGCLAVDTWSNLEFMGGPIVLKPSDLLNMDAWNSLMAAVVVVAIATAVSLAAAGASWRRGSKPLAVGLFVAFGCGAAFSLTATLDRVGSTRDAAIEDRQSHNVAIERTEAVLAAARVSLAEAEKGITIECEGAPVDLANWPMCRSYKSREAMARANLARSGEVLATLGARREIDSMGIRLSAILPWITARQVQTYQPLLLPAALFMFGNLLVAFGIASLNQSKAKHSAPRPNSGSPLQLIDVTPRPDETAVITRADQVAAYCKSFIAEHGREPSFSEVRAGTGLPGSTVSKYRVKALRESGIRD